MKYFTQNEALQFFKNLKWSTINFLLSSEHQITFTSKNSKYQYSIKWNKVNFTSEEYSNYSKLLDDCTKLLNKYKLIEKWKENTITITSEINDFQSDTPNWFSFDSLLQTKDINKNVQVLSESDIEEIILNDNLEKWIVSNWIITLYMKQGSSYQREYNRTTLISLIIRYIVNLVDNKKKLNSLVINNMISLYYETKSQNLMISEWEGDGGEVQSNWYLDNNLMNSSFVLCSLSDLVIDRTKLKIWLNKILVNTEKVWKIYFN